MPHINLKQLDWWLIISVILLGLAGIAILASGSLGGSQQILQNQLLFWVISFGLAAAVIATPWPQLIKAMPLIYLILIVTLIGLYIAGQATRGSVSWFYIGGYGFQPSELIKVPLAVTMASFYQWVIPKQWESWRRILGILTIGILPIGLTLIQPDFGTAAIMMVGLAVVIWLTTVNKKVLLAGAVAVGIAAIVGWQFLAPYQQQRVFTFINPAADPLGSGYNVLQSVIAVQSGGATGQGWGQGTQSHLNFLPEHHTDFIFASLSEELGFIGSTSIVILYGLLFWRGLHIAWRATDPASVIAVTAILCMLLTQAIINIAMNIGLAPVTGIPLPFVSYGGSSLMSSVLAIAVIISADLHQRHKERLIK